ncbi:hypothetical protein L6164_018914 [Bauhinia variegata]|uniref:Uncharacterized protein n=1 Tax=Bauhinia variegata TaxID=167791 RepID=A0ACB9NCN9_BAUVA|nr:hypothetical protein L6164_018914 [Bauhinia variegata]
MSKRGRGSSRMELRLNLSPHPAPTREQANSSSLADQSPDQFSTSSILSYSSEATATEGSIPSVSSVVEENHLELQQQHHNEHEHANMVTREMHLVGCPRCLMYVMLSEVDTDPKCPKCNNTVLLDFLNQQNSKKH